MKKNDRNVLWISLHIKKLSSELGPWTLKKSQQADVLINIEKKNHKNSDNCIKNSKILSDL